MVKIVFDYEGIINTPAVDFSWISYKKLVSKKTKREFPEKWIKIFDKYDDARWERERKIAGHSTGTTPLVIDCIIACDGISDHELISLAYSCIQENPGIEEIFDFLKKEYTQPFIITNSYPALALVTAYKYGINSSSVFTHGYQLSERDRMLMDSRKILDLEEEVLKRSPLPSIKPKEELEIFLRKYLNNCSELLNAYKSNNEFKIKKLEEKERKLFYNIKDKNLRKVLMYMFLSEKGIMGGHRKVDVLKKIKDKVVYFGDSIVDADAVRFADYGIAVNCTNKHCLLDAKLNLALSNFSDLIPLLEDILNEKFVVADAKKYETENMKVFLPDEITQNFNYVKFVNHKFKQELKNLFLYPI
jgi:predicted HAD superfamily phosphohydrolase